jgi:effector-binding domain-containing protein
MQKKGVVFLVFLIITFLVSNLFIPSLLKISRVQLTNTTVTTVERIMHTDSVFKRWCAKNNYTFTANTISKDGYTFTFNQIALNTIPIEISGAIKAESTFKLIPLNDTQCELNWATQLTSSTFFTRIFTYFKAQQLSKQLDYFLQQLKLFAESTTDTYGFDISIKKQTEPIVSFYTETVANNFVYEGIKQSYQNIKKFVEENKLVSKNTAVMLNINKTKMDSTTIMIGVPTQKNMVQGKYSTTQMPPEGNMLVAEYEGIYSNRTVIYKAMENYIKDKNLSVASIPYEKFTTGVLPDNKNSTVRFTMCYPVF